MKKERILIVDDDREILQIVKRTLELEGYTVDVATDGYIAVTRLRKRNPALVLLDIMMPGLDGYQVLDRIRRHSNVPVIMLTALGEVSALEKSVDLGADGYITKPFRTEELLARIKAVLRRSKPKAS